MVQAAVVSDNYNDYDLGNFNVATNEVWIGASATHTPEGTDKEDEEVKGSEDE